MRSAEPVMLANPLSSDMDVLRPSLLPGLIHSLRHNVSRKNYDVALFEVGRVFTQVNGQSREELRVAIALTGNRNPEFWSGGDREAKFDTYDLKGLLDLVGDGTDPAKPLAELGLVQLAIAGRADQRLDLVALLGGMRFEPVEEHRLDRQWQPQEQAPRRFGPRIGDGFNQPR